MPNSRPGRSFTALTNTAPMSLVGASDSSWPLHFRLARDRRLSAIRNKPMSGKTTSSVTSAIDDAGGRATQLVRRSVAVLTETSVRKIARVVKAEDATPFSLAGSGAGVVDMDGARQHRWQLLEWVVATCGT